MQTNIVQPVLLFILFTLLPALFVYIKYYLLKQEVGDSRSLRPHESAISILLGLIVFYMAGNRNIQLPTKILFFIASLGLHYMMSVIELKMKKRLFPKSFMIFHNGKFLKGAILQHKISEEYIRRLLHRKGIVDLKEVDTLILEQNGELVVIYKNKENTAAN